MRVLVLGSGAREHALCLALSRDPDVDAVICAPGNPGTAAVADNVAVDLADIGQVPSLAARARADYVIVGPEAPLVAGVADALRDAGFEVFGPSAAAARIEGSKAFAKTVMDRAGVPTAAWQRVTRGEELAAAWERFGPPYVVKDDALAAGKGVLVTSDRAAADAHARAVLAAGGPVVVEEYLDGPEVSLFAVVRADGSITPLLASQDAKRRDDGDAGPNTGGMGAYAPLPWAPGTLTEQVMAEVLVPTVAEMARQGCPFQGLLYAGLALTARGVRVVEFNCRFGDPETQAVLALLETPLTRVLRGSQEPRWRLGSAVTVVIAAPGYPQAPVAGGAVEGLLDAAEVPDVQVLHAGTRSAGGRVTVGGGRVLSVTATGIDLEAARMAAYSATARVRLDGGHYRHDIGLAAASGSIAVPQQTGEPGD